MKRDLEKFEIFYTYNFAKDKIVFDKIKNKLQEFFNENKIEYKIDLTEDKRVGSNKMPKTVYTFWLTIERSEEAKVKEYLEKIKTEILNENETITQEKEVSDVIEPRKAKILAKVFMILIFGSIIALEVGLIINFILKEEYTNIIFLILIIAMEVPYMRKIWKTITNRREE